MARKLRYGMIGGGLDAFIGAVHRKAAALDGEMELVCGAFSRSPDKSEATGSALYLDGARTYATYADMLECERALPPHSRIDFDSIVTPNDAHFLPAKSALESGFHVIIEKPLAFSSAEAMALKETVACTGRILAVTHTYSGYPMVKEARARIASGELGAIRKIYVEYPQGWLSTALEKTGQKQASWRTDPKRSGAGGAVGDIGTHAAHLAEYISGLKISAINAQLNTFVEGRAVRDHQSGKVIDPAQYDFPGIEEGVRGMRFIETAIESSQSDKKWIELP